LGFWANTILHDLGGTQRISTNGSGDLGRHARKVCCLFHRGISAADDSDFFSSIEGPSQCRAGADPIASVGAFKPEPSRRRTCGNDQGARSIARIVPLEGSPLGRRWFSPERPALRSTSKTVSHLQSARNRCACFRISSIRSDHRLVRKAREIVDSGCQRQLAPSSLPSKTTGADWRGGVERRRQACGTRANNDHFLFVSLASHPRTRDSEPPHRVGYRPILSFCSCRTKSASRRKL